MPNHENKASVFNKTSLKKTIMGDIYAQKIQPRPKWQYLVGHIFLWSICVLTLLVGAVAFSLMLMELDMPERVFIHWMDMQENTGLLLALPYLWLMGVILALCIGYFLFSRTGRGYKFHMIFVIGALLIGSLLLGWILFSSHAVQWGESRLQDMQPRYRDFRRGMKRMMPRPEDGVLPLRVITIESNTFFGHDPGGRSWEVLLVCREGECDASKIQINKPILFRGVIKMPGKFEATSFTRPDR